MSKITIEIDVDDYIDMLDDRRQEVKENFGWTIPDGVYKYFCEMLEEGITPSDPHPRYVIDNMTVNGDYGEIENYGILDKFLSHAKEQYLEVLANEPYPPEPFPTIEELNDEIFEEGLKDFIRENTEELIENSGIRDELFFTYKEESSEYGIGVCYSL